ncbi:MAG: VanW family protein [Candidatus Eisenbacteria bacterium]|uniref:VanW family protein n=1 Tax=Eiseniibacteriota bacterium TaxID=2212470 RepID=A0A933SAY6_UNCEI|nr:VanW family protein [Candidatus Eisenbacteria bacterium]
MKPLPSWTMVRASALAAALALALLPAGHARARAETPPGATAPLPGDSLAVASDTAEQFPVLLGSFTTTLHGSRPERTENIRLAVEALDGAILLPGDVLSFNERVGVRTSERGYLMAPVILHETRQLQAGGGICQVASTMFVAGLLSGLSVSERWRHSTPVDYIAIGEDATIAWGAKDLRLRNDLAQRVRLRVRIVGSTLSARFEGEQPEPGSIELATESRELPAEAGLDDARPGVEVELYRVRRGEDGAESRELVHRDVIPPSRGRKDVR